MPTYTKGTAIPSGRGLGGEGIEVTPTLISNIIGAPSVRDLVYPWPVDHLPICAEMVK
jgi:hypothetical protein